ncbi:MAG: tRNA epoxyqueuosine(34) reductase QueG [Verrucomicrobiota bacterium]|jgi:epoxyqueuosine reductase
MWTAEETGRIRARALELGFDDCRITDASDPETGVWFREALAEGRHGEMQWLARNAEKRLRPELVLPGVKSIVLVAASYDLPAEADPPGPGVPVPRGTVARYACREDYHDRMGARLRELSRFLEESGGEGARALWYVDTGPVLERDLARRAGLGFVGKHTNLVSRSLGNWILIGAVLTTVPLRPDLSEPNRCGTCTRCLDACPTAAFPRPFVLDARRCIAYLTIELKGSIPVEMRPLIGDRIFGCDDCLAACPWNRFARASALLKEGLRPGLRRPDLLAWLALDEAGFREVFAGTPMLRSKRRGLLRNVCVALGNVGDETALPALHRAAEDPEPLVAEHARWAIGRIQQRLSSTGLDAEAASG